MGAGKRSMLVSSVIVGDEACGMTITSSPCRVDPG